MTKILKSIAIMLVAVSLLAAPALAQDPMPPRESLEGAFKAQKHFSPYAGRNFPTQVCSNSIILLQYSYPPTIVLV